MLDLIEICTKCKAETERRIDNLLQGFEEREKALEAKPEPSDAVARLLDLLQEDIEWHEKYRPDSEKMKPIIAAYRELRPR